MTTIRERLEKLTPCIRIPHCKSNCTTAYQGNCPGSLRPALLALIADARAGEWERCAKMLENAGYLNSAVAMTITDIRSPGQGDENG